MPDDLHKPRRLTVAAEISAVVAALLAGVAIVIALLALQHDKEVAGSSAQRPPTSTPSTAAPSKTPFPSTSPTALPSSHAEDVSYGAAQVAEPDWRENWPVWAVVLMHVLWLIKTGLVVSIGLKAGGRVSVALVYLVTATYFVWMLWPSMGAAGALLPSLVAPVVLVRVATYDT